MRLSILAILLFFFSLPFYSQSKLDSLFEIATSNNCPQNAKAYQNIGNYYKNSNPDTALIFFEKAFELASECGETETAACCINVAGIIYFEKHKYAEALESFKKALDLSNNKLNKSVYNLNISEVYIEHGLFYEALGLLDEQLQTFEKENFTKGISAAYNNLGSIYLRIGSIDTALLLFNKSLEIEHSDSNLSAINYVNVAKAYIYLEQYEIAFEYLLDAEKILSLTKNISIIADLYKLYGKIYGVYEKFYISNDFYSQSLNLYKKINNAEEIFLCYINIANNYKKIGKDQKVQEQINLAFDIYSENMSLLTKSEFYYHLYKIEESSNNYKQSLLYYKKYKNYQDSAKLFVLLNIAQIKNYQSQKTYKQEIENEHKKTIYFILIILLSLIAITTLIIFGLRQKYLRKNITRIQRKYAEANVDLRYSNTKIEAQSIAFLALQKAAEPEKKLDVLLQEVLEEILNLPFLRIEKRGCIMIAQPDGKLKMLASLNMGVKVHECGLIEKDYCLCGLSFSEDKLITTNNLKEIDEDHTHGHYTAPLIWQDEKLGVINFYLKKEQVLSDNEIDFLNNFVLTTAGIIKQKKDAALVKERAKEQNIFSQKLFAQSLLIEQQKFEVEQSSKRIEDQSILLQQSIKNIQDSINYASYILTALLPRKKLIDWLLNEYFLMYRPKDVIGGDFYYVNRNKNYLIIALGDSTGHGVPGAFLSTLGITFLKDAIKKYDPANPALILEMLRSNIKSVFFNADMSISSNGFDMALVSIDVENEKLKYAGALIPLYIYRQKEMIKLKPNRSPIANHFLEEKFENQKFDLRENDILYMFSDGYPDQFGGTDNSKYTRKRFIEYLSSIAHYSMERQEEELMYQFENWKGDAEQTDDVSVFGIKWKKKDNLPS